MDTLLRDLRYAVRQLARQRAFTLTAVATLALGIGANTAMFGIVYGILLRPLPYPDAGAIVRIGESFGGRGQGAFLTNRSMALLEDDAESFEHLAAYRAAAVDWAGPDGAVTLRGARVSPSLFPLLRAAPHRGRLFTEEEGRAGADRVVLLSHGAWTNRFAADPDIVGAAVDLGGDPYTVVGVLAEGFYFPNPEGEFWMPFVVPPFTPPVLEPSGRFTVSVVAFSALGRLAPGSVARRRRPPRRAPSCSATTTASSPRAQRRPRPPGRRRARRRSPGGPPARTGGRRVPAGPARADRGHPARAAHRVQQRRRPAPRTGG